MVSAGALALVLPGQSHWAAAQVPWSTNAPHSRLPATRLTAGIQLTIYVIHGLSCTQPVLSPLLVYLQLSTTVFVNCAPHAPLPALCSYPALEQHVEQRRWALPWQAVTLFDPLLQPVRRRYFKQTEEGDLDFASVALLAAVCSLLECLVGKDGLMLPYIPDFVLREALQYLVVFQHGMLLPCWVIVVLRWGKVM